MRYFKAMTHRYGSGKVHIAVPYETPEGTMWVARCQKLRPGEREYAWPGKVLPDREFEISCGNCRNILAREKPSVLSMTRAEVKAEMPDTATRHMYDASFIDGLMDGRVACPVCNDSYIHPTGRSRSIFSGLEYGPVVSVGADCECGAALEIRMGNYKGSFGIDVVERDK